MKQIDERGNACPIPVVHTKKALESMNGETKLVVLVDNEPAVQNVTRFAEGKNCEVKSEKISDNEFKIEIMVENYTPADEEEEIVCAPSAKDDFIIVVSSNEMGQGEKALGQALIKAFLFAVTKQDKMKIFTPDQNQDADAWKMNYRRHHDLWVLENKIDSVFVSIKDAE